MYKRSWKYLLILLGISVPFFSFAATSTPSANLFSPLPVAQELFCPTAYCDLESMLVLVIRDFLTIIPIVSVLAIIIGGIQLVTSSGNEERISKGKRIILYAVLGLVFAFLSFSIIAIIQTFLGVNLTN